MQFLPGLSPGVGMLTDAKGARLHLFTRIMALYLSQYAFRYLRPSYNQNAVEFTFEISHVP